MMQVGIDSHWIRSIDGKLTFCGAFEECYDSCSKYWKMEKTRKQYNKDYNDKILPNLSSHDTKPIETYTKEDYDAAVIAISRQRQGRKGETFIPYADATLQHYRHLIEVVVSAASDYGLCDNVLWGSSFSLSEQQTIDDEIKDRVKLKKSLTIKQELDIARMLLSNIGQRGQEMGLLLMFALGLRNGEACGANYGDIKPMQLYPESKALWVYKSTIAGTNIVQSSGKTRNADRIIPIPEVLELFIEERRKYLEETVVFGSDDEIQTVNDLPIACVGDNYFLRCSASQLTAACRELFRQISVEKDQLAYIDAELSQGALAEEIVEKDPTAYLLRRNYGTHLHILGLTEAEIQYIIGHDIEDAYETRNEFVNEEKLFEIKLKLDQRPILNTAYMLTVPHDTENISNKRYIVNNANSKKFGFPLVSGCIKIHLTAQEPLDALKIKLEAVPQSETIRKTTFISAVTMKYGRSINIIKKYQKLYQKSEQK